MDGILAWGLDLVRTVQVAASPALTLVMKAFTALGSEWFYLALLPLIYWCVDRRRGIRLSILFVFSTFINFWLKNLFAQPRPFQFDPKVGLAAEPSFGLPSNHAQGSVVFWGGLARLFRKPWGLVLAVSLPLVVGFSRVYLGVHFPTDVFAGWLLGAFFIAIDIFAGDRIAAFLAGLSMRLKAAAAAAAALLMNALDKSDTSISGVFLGGVLGFILADKYARFSVAGGLGKKALRYLLGLAGAGLIYFGLKLAFPGQDSAYYALFRFLRYGILGAWFGLGAPWLFIRLKLAALE